MIIGYRMETKSFISSPFVFSHLQGSLGLQWYLTLYMMVAGTSLIFLNSNQRGMQSISGLILAERISVYGDYKVLEFLPLSQHGSSSDRKNQTTTCTTSFGSRAISPVTHSFFG
jgi:hypothetical protein